MKNIILVFAMMILFSSCVVTASEVESSTNQELFRSGWFHPKPYVNPRKAFPGIIRCLSDKEEVSACFDYIVRSFYTGAECCDAINKMTQDCETVFGSFRNSFYTDFVKLHCSIVVGSTSPAPPSQPPSYAPSHAPSLGPSHSPLYASSSALSLAPSSAPLLVAPSLATSSAPSLAPSHVPLLAPSSATSPASLHAPSPSQGF